MDPELSATLRRAPESASHQRILWLDVLRALCAIEIVGFHWLRAATKADAFPVGLPHNFILEYRQLNIGAAEAFERLHADVPGPAWHRWIYDSLAVAFGFGWEAVYVFVILSGLSLATSLGKSGRPSSWPIWIWRRIKRILLPFYVISLTIGAIIFGMFAFTASRPDALLNELYQKLAANIGSDFVGLAWSQVLLVDPHKPFWEPSFLSPAWWFVPAIVLAYALFPIYIWLLERLGSALFLTLGASITIASYSASLYVALPEFSWNFVVFNESFNFFLGIVLGRFIATPQGRSAIERWIQSPKRILCALLIFFAGNICNVYLGTYPISSMLFAASLAFCGAAVARKIMASHGRRLLKIDSFHLYLIHQPFAFPLMVTSRMMFGSVAVLVGLPIYLAVAILVTAICSRMLARITS